MRYRFGDSQVFLRGTIVWATGRLTLWLILFLVQFRNFSPWQKKFTVALKIKIKISIGYTAYAVYDTHMRYTAITAYSDFPGRG